jgi:hypothetical protein
MESFALGVDYLCGTKTTGNHASLKAKRLANKRGVERIALKVKQKILLIVRKVGKL